MNWKCNYILPWTLERINKTIQLVECYKDQQPPIKSLSDSRLFTYYESNRQSSELTLLFECHSCLFTHKPLGLTFSSPLF